MAITSYAAQGSKYYDGGSIISGGGVFGPGVRYFRGSKYYVTGTILTMYAYGGAVYFTSAHLPQMIIMFISAADLLFNN